ncbi:hypothetical protein C0993_004351 [Termitomyces sp. T159_Od127]|nr:hypothetical protein C0993_004351 [Termitomyces sp. T159_Od127]
MAYAFPMDELTPLSCTGQGPDWGNPWNIASNDVAGNFSLTLIDVLDTLVVLDDRQGFEQAVKNIINWVSFDVNTKPQVFETTIRVMGGLLSGHIFANQSGQPFYLPWYRGELLEMAHDLGKRLLPAFKTPTGLPYARVNLRHGVTKGESLETCTAGAGSLILEFATLSRLTGDDRFEKAAHKAFFGIWNRKSNIGLVGNTINTWTGAWTSPEVTSIGAGVDSFYEYALKWYILSGDVEYLDVWEEAYAAVMRFSRATDGFWYRTVHMDSGDVAYFTVDSLSAFWPGLQVLAGDIQSAIRLHLIYYNLWRTHSGLPEVYDTNFKKATSHQYPLRPEFIESTWYLYRATRDPFYLDVGERVLFDLITRSKVDCGLAGIQDLRTNKRDDRMESFALSETLKYLYLLFDEDNPLHNGRAVPEDLSPSLLKLGVLPDGFILQNVTGIRTHIVRRLDGNGYDIRKLGHYTVRTGHIVYINDSSLLAHLDSKRTDAKELDVLLRFYAEDVDSLTQNTGLPPVTSDDTQVLLVAYTAQFGGTFNIKPQSDPDSSHFAHKVGVNVYRDADNPLGCAPYRHSHPSSVLVVHRGECAFLEKLIYARDALAVGVVVISDDDLAINPTANADELQAAGDLSNTALVLLPHKAGEILLEMMRRAEQGIISQVKMVLEDDTADTPSSKDPDRILYINGHPLRNTRLWA